MARSFAFPVWDTYEFPFRNRTSFGCGHSTIPLGGIGINIDVIIDVVINLDVDIVPVFDVDDDDK
jgi:hypothetical protein